MFYSLTGAGHLRVAQTLAGQLQTLAPDCEVVLHDGLAGPRRGPLIDPSRAYATLTTTLIWLFNVLYRVSDNRIGVGILRALIKLVWGESFAGVIDREAPDLAVSTHSFISPSTLGPTLHHPCWATVVTDLGLPHRLWLDPRSDQLIVLTPAMAEYAHRQARVPGDRIVTLDHEYPIDPRFHLATNPRARTWTVLVLGGGVGAGQIPLHVSALRRNFPEAKIVVLCGHNARLKIQLAKQSDEKLEVHSFVDRLDVFMRQADVIVSKAGPATIAEAAVMRKPLIITSWVGLQERENVKLVVDRGLGLYCPRPRDLPAALSRIYQDYEIFCRGDQVFRPGAAKIATILLNRGQDSNLPSER